LNGFQGLIFAANYLPTMSAKQFAHGGLNLRDHTGIIQVKTLPQEFPAAHYAIINNVRLEYVVAIQGVVRSRLIQSIDNK